VLSHELFLMEAQHSDEEYRELLDELGVEAIVLVFPEGAGHSETYIPQRTYTRTKGGSTTSQTYGGYNILKPWFNFEAQLYDVKEDELVWYATISSSGNTFSNLKTLVKAAGGKVVKKLVQDQLIP